jgi:Large polyvalent protein-associated domain 7
MADEDGLSAAIPPSERASKRAQGKEEARVSGTRVQREPPVNGIEAGPRERRARPPSAPVTRETDPSASPQAREPAPASRTDFIPRADTDSWTVPQSVRDRFVQDGHRFYFPDGAPAFRDLGRRLTTPSENTQVIHSLIEIARSRGWTEVRVTGTERFRHEAWRQARLAGLSVHGFRPSEEQRAQVVRDLSRNLRQPAERADSLSADAGLASAPPVDRSTDPSSVPRYPDSSSIGFGGTRERIAGRLLDHGRDAYRHDPNEDPSYFVRLQTRDGPREIWGKDIERAVTKSLTQPQRGDEVILQRTGRDAVTVQREEKDVDGQIQSRPVDVYRNRWVIEKREFFEERAEAARIVRDETIKPREAVREHPELAGTYLSLRAAELAARGLRDSEDQRRFVSQVRRALADDIERGEPLQPVRLRERSIPAPARPARDVAHEITR